jgi:hypothetical protein
MKRKLLFALFSLVIGGGNLWAQGTWTAPAVPGADLSSLDGNTNYYLYNVGSDAFVTYGMSWNTNAIARRLSSGDQAESPIHAMTATNPSAGTARFHLNDVTADKYIGTNQGNCDVWVDFGSNYDWTYAASESVSGAYTLTMGGNKLDVSWAYGGHLTTTGGQGFYDWALIPVTSITDGSYAKYKERKQMYAVYQALVAAGVVSSYTSALETANNVYVNSSATVSDLRSATRTLINAAAEDIASSINGNSLFDDADMWGNQAITTWTSTSPSNSDGGEYETYNVHYDFNQTHDVPNGTYKIVFHSLFRNDGGGTAPRIVVTDGELDGGGTTASANVPLFTSLSFGPNVDNNSGGAITGTDKKNGYYSDWVQNGGVWIPNGRRSSADALAHTNAVAEVDNFKVTKGKMNIRLIIDQNSQWVNFQGFDIIFYGSTTGKLYRDLAALLATSSEYSSEAMGTTEASEISRVLSAYASYTKSNSESELEAAVADVTSVNAAAAASIARTAHVTAITSNNGDITSLINGTFDTNADGWTGYTGRPDNLGRSWRGEGINPFIERNADGTMTTTVANMPAGTYKVVAAARTYAGGKLKAQVAGGEYGAELTGTGDAAPAAGTMEINTNGVEMPYSSLGGFTTVDTGHNWHWITATGTLAADGDLVINITTTGNSWMAIDDVHLYCTELDGTSYTKTLPTISANTDLSSYADGSVITCDIAVSNPNAMMYSSTGYNVTTAAGSSLNNYLYKKSGYGGAFQADNVVLYDGTAYETPSNNKGIYFNNATLYRNIPANTWCTLVVPFWPKDSRLTRMYPSELSDAGVLTFSTATNSTWDSNDKPMLVKSSEAMTSITGVRGGSGAGGAGTATGNMSSGEGVNMIGTYTAISAVPQGSYVVARVGDEDNLYKVDGDVSLAPFRAYFSIPTASGNVKADVIRLNFDDNETAIAEIENGEVKTINGPIFNLAGQRMSKVQRGVNIINGKKVLVK